MFRLYNEIDGSGQIGVDIDVINKQAHVGAADSKNTSTQFLIDKNSFDEFFEKYYNGEKGKQVIYQDDDRYLVLETTENKDKILTLYIDDKLFVKAEKTKYE